MRLLLLSLVVFVMAACAAIETGPNAQATESLPFAVTDPQELVVLTADPPQDLIARVEPLGYVVRAVHPLPDLQDTLVVLRIPATRTIPTAIEEVERIAPGVTAGANHIYRLQAVRAVDPRDYAAGMINWPTGGCRAQVRVGMIDAGVTSNHPALGSGRIAQRNFVERAANTRHGDEVAELLIGEGRLRDTTLFSANVVDPALDGGDAAGVVAILRAVDWLAAENVKVVNFSLAGPYNKLMDRALSRAARDGMVFVAAVGNAGPRHQPQYPAAFPFALAVTAVDRDGMIFRNAVRGPHVDLAAPGVDILLSIGDRRFVSSGTSLAAPHVTMVIAADRSMAALSAEGVRTALATGAEDLGPNGHDRTFGNGLLQVTGACSAG
ncbi:S8 family serine peptidase [Thalassococcus sp. S3]|uniref:S8 family serine peptidase n=1 Tax=Thalassococcus sp. S3 TaxID=2017482 RepID=UPI00102415F4|nr:S8 family serine peptidase [Thalassococcus sp. S3]QBF32633.1 peptidase S8 [Thalassococcus sp. S3]